MKRTAGFTCLAIAGICLFHSWQHPANAEVVAQCEGEEKDSKDKECDGMEYCADVVTECTACANSVNCGPGVTATICEYGLDVVPLGTCQDSEGDPSAPYHHPYCVWCDGAVRCAEGVGYADLDDCQNDIEACAVYRTTTNGKCYDTYWLEPLPL